MPQVRAGQLEAKNVGGVIEFYDGDSQIFAVIDGFSMDGDQVKVWTNVSEQPYGFHALDSVIVSLRNGDFFMHALSRDMQRFMESQGYAYQPSPAFN